MTSIWQSRAKVHAVLADEHRLAVLHEVALGDHTPKYLATLLDIPMPLLSHHLNVLGQAGLVRRITSEHDRRKRFVSLDPAAVGYLDHHWLRKHVTTPSGRVVFACTRNSARSVLAAALWSDQFHRPAGAGGTVPGERIHPATRLVARRHHVPLLQEVPAALDDVLSDSDLLVTVCDSANEQVPTHPQRLHWSIPDPAAAGDSQAFEKTFDLIRERVDRLGLALNQTDSEGKQP